MGVVFVNIPGSHLDITSNFTPIQVYPANMAQKAKSFQEYVAKFIDMYFVSKIFINDRTKKFMVCELFNFCVIRFTSSFPASWTMGFSRRVLVISEAFVFLHIHIRFVLSSPSLYFIQVTMIDLLGCRFRCRMYKYPLFFGEGAYR